MQGGSGHAGFNPEIVLRSAKNHVHFHEIAYAVGVLFTLSNIVFYHNIGAIE